MPSSLLELIQPENETPSSSRAFGRGSTGPRTKAGLRAIASNNLRHGLCSRRTVLPGEDVTEFELYRDELVHDLQPEGAIEELLVERIVIAGWRLRRATLAEAQILDLADQPRRLKSFIGPAVVSIAHPAVPRPLEHQVGVAFATSAQGVLDRLARYETTAERSLHRNLHELERLQARRAGITVAPPIAVDVDVTGVNFESQNQS